MLRSRQLAATAHNVPLAVAQSRHFPPDRLTDAGFVDALVGLTRSCRPSLLPHTLAAVSREPGTYLRGSMLRRGSDVWPSTDEGQSQSPTSLKHAVSKIRASS